MNLKYFILAGVSVAAISTISVPALATPQTVNANQWYTVGFGTAGGNAAVGNALGGNAIQFLGTGFDGPILPSGQAGAIGMTATSWTISAPNGGYLTITDVETSGDQFQLTDNGSLMTPTTTAGALGGQIGLTNGLTSTPIGGDLDCGDNIACALADTDYSSGTFILAPGTNVISATEAAVAANASAGDANFVIELNSSGTSVPEPVSLSLLGAGLAGLGVVRRRRTK